MGRYFPKINLRPDLPPGSQVHKPHKVRRSRLVLLVVGLFLFIVLLVYFKGSEKKETPRITVRMGTVKAGKGKKARHPSLEHPPSPGNEGETKIPSRELPPPSPPAKAQRILTSPPPKEGKKPQEVTPAKIQIPSANLGPKGAPILKKAPPKGEEKLEVVLFPGLSPMKIKKSLTQRGIPFQEGTREVTTTLWRVVVETSSPTLKKDMERIRALTGEPPWRLSYQSKPFLAVASFKEKASARGLVDRLKKGGFKVDLLPVTKRVTLKVISFSLKKEGWKGLKATLEELGAQVLEEIPLESKTSLPQPRSTTSHGKGSSSLLPR